MKTKFELTAEEVEVVYNTLNGLKTLTSLIYPTWKISNDDSYNTQIAEKLITRIKQWQNEQKMETSHNKQGNL